MFARLLFLNSTKGTLTSIRKTPDAAVPSAKMLEALRNLTRDPDTFVYVISGRDQKALDNWLSSVNRLGMRFEFEWHRWLTVDNSSAEHGCFVKYSETNEWINLSEDVDFSWMNDILPIFEVSIDFSASCVIVHLQYYTERTPGSFVERKRSSLTWHYRLADPDYG